MSIRINDRMAIRAETFISTYLRHFHLPSCTGDTLLGLEVAVAAAAAAAAVVVVVVAAAAAKRLLLAAAVATGTVELPSFLARTRL